MARGPVAVAASLVLATAALTACGGAGDTSAVCAPVERVRAQFPASHLLPGQPEPRYLSEPPTSGPHVAVLAVPTGVAEPLARPLQVGLLELGVVLVQYRPEDLSPVEVDEVRALAGPRVVVAPDPDLPGPVVASAWLALQRCDGVDAAALARFAADHARDTPVDVSGSSR